MIGLVLRFILPMSMLYSGGYLAVGALKKLKKAGKIKTSRGLSPMREFNRKLFEKYGDGISTL